jgi:uncharacterized membrane protein
LLSVCFTLKSNNVPSHQPGSHEKQIHRLFEFGVGLKALHAVIELITGSAILVLSPVTVSNFFVALAHREQALGSNQFIANFLLHVARADLHGQHFAGIYLLAVGFINLGLAIGLLTGKLWSFPAALAALALLMAYQLYRYTHTHAIALIALAVFDAGVWLLVWHEYRMLRSGMAWNQRPSKSSVVPG